MDDPIIATTAGPVRGVTDTGVRRFLGVPYAAPPLGSLRFQPPKPPKPWTRVRDATRLGPTAPHASRPPGTVDLTPLSGPGWVRGDDYLNVNIWTPERPARPLPVMVFVHGGGFVSGGNHGAAQNGAAFARSGVVCVTLTYRLGVEGFLPIPGVATNLGLRDILAALAWTRENIAAFGGDPANLTLFGDSAGATAVACLVASPLAKGAFRRAILQSGHASMVRSLTVGRRLAAHLARALKTTADRPGFLARTSQQCVDAAESVQSGDTRIDLRDTEGRDAAFGITAFLPVYGDDVLPVPPLEALANGAGSGVEVLIGAGDAVSPRCAGSSGTLPQTSAWAAWRMLRRSEPRAGRMLIAYGLGKDRGPAEALALAVGDLAHRLPVRRFAESHQGRTHVYDFGWRSPTASERDASRPALETPFVFNTLQSCAGPRGLVGEDAPQALADSLHALWVDFATTGDLPWPAYDVADRLVYRLESGAADRAADLPAAAVAGGR